MAIQPIKGKKGTAWRAYWRNPLTKKLEYSQVFHDELDARDFDTAVRRRLKNDPNSFAPAAQEAKQSQDTLTFRKLGRAYLEEVSLAPSTLQPTLSYLDNQIYPHIGDKPVADLTPADLRVMEKAWRDQGNKQPTLNRKVSIIQAILNWAVKEERIPANPVASHKCERGFTLKVPPPSPAELAAIYEAAAPHVRRVVLLGAALGARIGETELFRSRWSDVDWEQGFVRIWSAQKNREMPYRDVPVSPALLETLRAWRAEDGPEATFIITYWGAPVSSIKGAWKMTLKRAGITRYLRPYDLRHYFATRALGNGADLKATSVLMGHSTTKLTSDTYQHVIDENRRRVASLVELPGLCEKQDPQDRSQGS